MLVCPESKVPVRLLPIEDGAGAYPVCDGFPVLLTPETLVPAGQNRWIDVEEKYAEAYEEMQHHGSDRSVGSAHRGNLGGRTRPGTRPHPPTRTLAGKTRSGRIGKMEDWIKLADSDSLPDWNQCGDPCDPANGAHRNNRELIFQ